MDLCRIQVKPDCGPPHRTNDEGQGAAIAVPVDYSDHPVVKNLPLQPEDQNGYFGYQMACKTADENERGRAVNVARTIDHMLLLAKRHGPLSDVRIAAKEEEDGLVVVTLLSKRFTGPVE